MSDPIMPLRSIIIPAAGKGKRMRPATTVTSKELLPVYDRLVIQFAIDEAIAVGAERIIVVVSAEKPNIREFLGETAVASTEAATALGKVRMPIEIVYAMQDEPKGLGHAISCCRELTLPGPFGVILPDDIIMGNHCLPDMSAHYTGGHMIAAMMVPEQDTDQYGIFALNGSASSVCIPVTGMVEKPARGQAPSMLAAVGRYILHPMIFDVLDLTPKGAGDEVQLTDAIAIAARAVPLTAFRFKGTRHDCGSHDGLLSASLARQTTVKTGRQNPLSPKVHLSVRSEKNAGANGSVQNGPEFEGLLRGSWSYAS